MDEFLRLKPKRELFEWHVSHEGLVQIVVPKFKSTFGKSVCRLLRKEETFTADFDKVGSLVWQACDGQTTVKNMLVQLQKTFPNEKNLDQRLILFLQQMQGLNYIEW